jgi:hypothetical protein
MTACRYNQGAADYLTPDGEPCRHDDDGLPTEHCTARRTCSVHIGPAELTCPRCIGRTRSDIAWVRNLAALMPTEALNTGVDSEAANLAGPAADTEAWSWRKVAARQGRAWHLSLTEDDDERHPYTVLTRWTLMLAEDYGHDLPVLNVEFAAGYLDRILAVMANDSGQDFPLMAREIRKCRAHLEAVLRNGSRPEMGVPCPDCDKPKPRLTRTYGHWCEDEACEKIHHVDNSGDRWVCPREKNHWWSEHDYRLRVADDYKQATDVSA